MTMFETLIRVEDLRDLLKSGADVAVFDCSFDLSDLEAGRRAFAEGHIPGARHLHLEDDMSGAATGGNGRHPLPDREAFAARLRELGVNDGTQVVGYDINGSAGAARLWWLLRWIGHRAVAALDGGKPAWVAAGGALDTGTGPATAAPGNIAVGTSLVPETVTAQHVLENIESAERTVIDARDPARFRGDPSAPDPVKGRIPGAKNRFFRDNLDGEGRFHSPGDLAAGFAAVLGHNAAERVILQCGSGVTACHNALALEIAGMPGARLYPGSWSEWIADPARPVEKG
jgi:thiosulfate/3-mercaptopyruvate sulfurtransferase